jgi:hypothetical protein
MFVGRKKTLGASGVMDSPHLSRSTKADITFRKLGHPERVSFYHRMTVFNDFDARILADCHGSYRSKYGLLRRLQTPNAVLGYLQSRHKLLVHDRKVSIMRDPGF